MANNPLKYRDFIEPDDTLKVLLQNLTDIKAKYEELSAKIQSDGAAIETALKKNTGATTEGKEAIEKSIPKVDELAKASERLAKAQGENAKKIAQVKAELKKANNITKLEVAQNKAAKGSYDQLSATYSLMKIKLNAMSSAQREGTKSGRAYEAQSKRIYEQMNRLQKATGKHQLGVARYAQGLGSAVKSLAGMYLGVAGLRKLFNSFTDNVIGFEKQMSGLKAISGATGDEFKELRDDAMALGAATTKTAIEVGSLQTEFAKLGFSTKEILDATKATILLSEATGEDVAMAAQVAGATLRGFGKDAAETGQVVDVMAKSFTSSALNLERFAESMKYVAPVAKASHVSLEMVTAAMSALADAGIHGSMAGTALRRILTEFDKSGKPFGEQLDALAAKGLTLADANDEVGRRAQTALLILSENTDKIKELTEAYENAGGSAEEMADIQRDNLAGALKLAGSAWAGLMLRIGESNGFMRKFIDNLTEVLSLAETAPQAASRLSDLAAKSWADATENTAEYIAGLEKANKAQTQLTIEALNAFIDAGGGADLSKYWETQVQIGKNLREELARARTKLEAEELAKRFDLENKSVEELMLLSKSLSSFKTGERAKQWAILKPIVEKQLKEMTDLERAAAEKAAAEALLNVTKIRDLQISMMNEGKEKELAILARSFDKKKILFAKYGMDQAVLDEWLVTQTKKINDKYAKKEADAAKKARDKKAREEKKAADAAAKLKKKESDAAVKAINEQKALRDSEIELVKGTEAEKTRLTLQAEKERLQALLKLSKAGGLELSRAQIDTMKNSIKALDGQMATVGAKDYDLYSLAGLNLSDEKKEAISLSTQFALENVSQFLGAKIAAADQLVALAERERSEADKNLDRELENRNAGYASNVIQAQKDLALAKKNQDKALKEQEKAKKAQILMESGLQASSLITASAKIWGQLGVWAPAALAVMWGSFAMSKIQAVKATKVQKFGTGGTGTVEGGSHASGNDVHFGNKTDGTELRAEGGERWAIFNKKSSSRYRNILPGVINSLNKGTFERQYLAGYNSDGLNVSVQAQAPSLGALEGDVAAIRQQGERRFHTNSQGQTVETYKNLTRTYSC